MVETTVESPPVETELSDEEAIMKIAAAMKDAPSTEDKVNVHTFLLNVVQEEVPIKVARIGNLRDDKEMNELGKPIWTVRGSFGMALIAKEIMDNPFFTNFFEQDAMITLGTSLSREGFLVRQATTTTKAVADATKRKKYNTGMFKKGVAEESGGDPYKSQ